MTREGEGEGGEEGRKEGGRARASACRYIRVEFREQGPSDKLLGS